MELVVTSSKHLYLLEPLKVFKTHKTLALPRAITPCSLLYFLNLLGGESGRVHLTIILLTHLDSLLEESLLFGLSFSFGVITTLHTVEEHLHHQVLLTLAGFFFLLVHSFLNLTQLLRLIASFVILGFVIVF